MREECSMAYFKKNDPLQEDAYYPDEEEEYDDGFDELNGEEEIPELSEEEIRDRRAGRIRTAVGAGNLLAVIGGTLLIFLLLTMIISIVHFVMTDMGRSFSLFQTNF